MNFFVALLVAVATFSQKVASLQLREGSSSSSLQQHAATSIQNRLADFVGYINSVVGVAQVRQNSPAEAMTRTLIAQYHLESLKASEANAVPVLAVDGSLTNADANIADPKTAPTSFLKKPEKYFVARNACTKGSIFTYGESVGR